MLCVAVLVDYWHAKERVQRTLNKRSRSYKWACIKLNAAMKKFKTAKGYASEEAAKVRMLPFEYPCTPSSHTVCFQFRRRH